jgi:hypothetical protein
VLKSFARAALITALAGTGCVSRALWEEQARRGNVSREELVVAISPEEGNGCFALA